MDYCLYCMSRISENDEVCPKCGRSLNYDCPAHHLLPGTILYRKFLVGAAIGEGGFGITYIGRDINLDIRVAIKEYYPNGYANRNNTSSAGVTEPKTSDRKEFFDKGRKSFLNEARALAKFSGEPGIVDVRDFFEENNTAYIVMEYLDGQTLKNYIHENGTMSSGKIIKMLLPMMRSLQKVHREGLIHRDISPDNIMVVGSQVKLLDFGAARSISSDANKSLSVMLKPGYAPEEQYRSRGKQGPWTDIYALCATIYKCVTGITPDDSTERLVNDELKKPSELGAQIDPHVEIALMKGMSVSAKDRYQSIDELLADLSEDKTELKETKSAAISVEDEEEKTIYSQGNDAETNIPKKPERENQPAASEQKKNKELDSPENDAESSIWKTPEKENPPLTAEKKKDKTTHSQKKKDIKNASRIQEKENLSLNPEKKKRKLSLKKVLLIIGIVLLLGIVLIVAIVFGEKKQGRDSGETNPVIEVTENMLWGKHRSTYAPEDFVSHVQFKEMQWNINASDEKEAVLFNVSTLPYYVEANPEHKDVLMVLFLDQDGVEFGSYGTYSVSGGKLVVSPPENEIESKWLPLAEPLEYELEYYNGAIMVSDGTDKIALRDENSLSDGELTLRGRAEKQCYKGVRQIDVKCRLDSRDAESCSVVFEDGGYAVDPVCTVYESIGSILIKWTKENRPYNTREKTFDNAGNLSFSFVNTDPCGFVLIDSDGVCYSYQSAASFDDQAEYVNSYRAPEKLGTDLSKGIAEIDGELYSFPIPVSAFVENGWKLKIDGEEIPDPSMRYFEAGAEIHIELWKTGYYISDVARNLSDDLLSIGECLLTEIGCDDERPQMVLPGGIAVGMSITDFEDLVPKSQRDYDIVNDTVCASVWAEDGTNHHHFMDKEYIRIEFGNDEKIKKIHMNSLLP